MNSTQQQWAKDFNRQQTKARHKNNMPDILQDKHITEEMDHFKQQLINSLNAGSKESAEAILKQLITLRARQLHIELEAGKSKKEETNRYYKDCAKLIQSTATLLSKTHA